MKQLLITVFVALIFSSCGFKKTTIYDFATTKGWQDYGVDLQKEFSENANLNQIELLINNENKLMHCLADCQNTNPKYSGYLIRKSYQHTQAGYNWTLSEGTDLYIKGDDGKQIKDIEPFITPIKSVNFESIGKTFEKLVAQNKDAQLFKADIYFYKNPKDQFIEILWLKKDNSNETKQYTMNGEELTEETEVTEQEATEEEMEEEKTTETK
jgi:hypothetical protein